METLPHTRGCFVCGVANAAGLRLDLTTDGTAVETRVVFRPEHAGFGGVVHGGLLVTVLDEAMAWVIGVRTGGFAFAAELNTRFLHPVAPGETVTVRAGLAEDRRGRLFVTRGTLRLADGTTAAEATGKFLPIPAARRGAILADFAEDPSRWIRPATTPGGGAG